MKFRENLVEIMKQRGVAVHCDTEEKARALLDKLGKCGVRWRDGERIGIFTYWDFNEEDTCYCVYDDGLVHSPKGFYVRYDYRIIEFEELLEEPMDNGASMDEINDIVNSLESVAETEFNAAVKQAEAYKEGYIAACEAFRREVRDILIGV